MTLPLFQFREFTAKAREAFEAARASYGLVRKVNLTSARHYLRMALMSYNVSRGVVV